jgi:hypothetical protein
MTVAWTSTPVPRPPLRYSLLSAMEVHGTCPQSQSPSVAYSPLSHTSQPRKDAPWSWH